MDNQTRRDVDAACLRLLGYEPQWDADYGDWAVMIGGSRRHRCLSRDPSFIVPLAEALRARGMYPEMIAEQGHWQVDVRIGDKSLCPRVYADTLPEALAIAAARAVGNANG